MTLSLKEYIQKFGTSVTEEIVTSSSITGIYYDFRKGKVTIDLLHERVKNKAFEERNYHLIEFLEISVFLVHEDESFLEGLQYKEPQYLHAFSILTKDERLKLQVSSQEKPHPSGGSYHTDHESFCNVYMEIAESEIFIKANKIRINNKEFILE